MNTSATLLVKGTRAAMRAFGKELVRNSVPFVMEGTYLWRVPDTLKVRTAIQIVKINVGSTLLILNKKS
ncbi:MAG: hypothetical protein KGO98_05810 [Rickettsiales bacterium]|nr:hypothetical protein [Rickettsiales bacterium]